MFLFQETAGYHDVEKFQHRCEEAGDVEQADGFVVQAELEPRQCLEQFFQRTDAAGQDDEAIAEVRHQLLALMHGADAVHFSCPGVGEFLVGEVMRDDANDFASGGERGIGEQAHQPDIAAAIDEADGLRRKLGAAVLRGFGEFREGAGAGATVDAEAVEHIEF